MIQINFPLRNANYCNHLLVTQEWPLYIINFTFHLFNSTLSTSFFLFNEKNIVGIDENINKWNQRFIIFCFKNHDVTVISISKLK